MSDESTACGCVSVVVVIILAVGGVTFVTNGVREFFSSDPPRVVVSAVTPANIEVNYLYRASADGPFRIVERDPQGILRTTDHRSDGWCVAGCDNGGMSKEKRVIKITSLAQGREVRVTLRECRIREHLFRYSCD